MCLDVHFLLIKLNCTGNGIFSDNLCITDLLKLLSKRSASNTGVRRWENVSIHYSTV